MSYNVDSIPDLHGTTAVVTGANGGLGLATANALAARGAHVVVAARDAAKADAAVEQIRSTAPDASVEVVPLDLGSLASVALAAETITSGHSKVDILVNNAGLMAMPEGRTADGFETQFGVNHLGHWALTAQLMPALLAAPSARVVTVTSSAHHFGRRVDPGNPHLRGNYGPWKGYGQSKLANYHFALGLQRAFERNQASATSLLAHPGGANTNLQSHTVAEGGAGFLGTLSLRIVEPFGMPPAAGALPQIRAATDPTAKGGQFYAPRYFTHGPPVARPVLRLGNSAAIKTLWTVSEHETGIAMDL